MTCKRWFGLALVAAFAAVFWSSRSVAVVFSQSRGLWPAELEPFRATSRTVGVATGTQENIYEIPIGDQQTFERVWAAVRTLATPGGRLTLYHKDSLPLRWGHFTDNERTTIRIFAPTGGTNSKNRETLKVGPPWPNSIIGPGGKLPEYVTIDTDDKAHAVWVAADQPHDASHPRGFLNRARIDLDLIVDGTTVDLNRIQLPDNVLVVDRRFSGEK